jgi:hypothetical protein
MTIKKTILLALVVVLLLVIGGVALAAPLPAINWFVFSGGGARVTGSHGQVLTSSLGQTAIGFSSSAHSSLSAGYLASEQGYLLFVPSVHRP